MTDTERKQRGAFIRVHENAIASTPVMIVLFKSYQAEWGRWERQRPTEQQALHKILHGWIPTVNGASVDDTLSLTSQLRERVAVPFDFDYEVKPHRDAIGQACIDCGKRKPLTEDFWDKDSTCRHGYKTQCKQCRRAYQRVRYATLTRKVA